MGGVWRVRCAGLCWAVLVLRAHSPTTRGRAPATACLQVLGGEGPAPDACTPQVLEHILQQHMDSPRWVGVGWVSC